MTAEVQFIGRVRTQFDDLEKCPKQGNEGGKEAWVEINPEFAAGLTELYVGQSIDLLTWFHKADRTTLEVHPRGDRSRPKRGVFATRSPSRPNPIGVHTVTILEIAENKLRVDLLEALDKTPLIDIKKTPTPANLITPVNIRREDIDEITLICSKAWTRRLFSGFNGNASIRLGDACLMTATGSAKGCLEPKDFVLVDIASGKILAGSKPSSEGEMHLEIYRNQPKARAILHTHPPKILALGVLVEPAQMLKLPIFETDLIGSRMTTAPAFEPGTVELAQATGKAAMTHDAVYMEKHGLVCWADTLSHALSLSEELEHLASIHVDVVR
ncbi:tRNA (N6-threonylcarbamoyladenosine(37)-N6)-methyltransferase TrmO [Halodesulfovibrio marinisediminis]|uniref:L-fuculose-phosphate aldolase n=1 Tax=Halodesulfovibrio marinisediminis DSM 17456 TaxID=1121457 RepID=A0A1N6J4I7_9BACT|nr:tRNA (N6-threonylcarbamoyladenosine(37)-N6)-methyltransferase TrmO [Halodesulfovibrio marinisediminis]SIO39165.1 L-fuculose-phosphate aldolase [Halodesulfovibrio marinisediminis DSM 17456]